MHDVIVVGGGLAGCSAAIRLAEAGFDVRLVEKRALPADKLCGEFLSVEVAAHFDRLGVLGAVQAAGAHPIHRTRITTMGRTVFEADLPGTALGLSRHSLDHILFERGRTLGVEATDGTAVTEVRGSLADGFRVEAGGEALEARMVLGAYGRRGMLDRKLGRRAFQARSPYVAFKAHYAGLDLPGIIELHAFSGGYCGLSQVEGGRVNVCWIAHVDALAAGGGTPEGMIARVMRRNRALDARFARLTRVSERHLAVSQIMLAPKGCVERDVLMIGDTAGMIAPLCGDGMAMALRSAELAVPWVQRRLRGHVEAAALRAGYTRAWHRAFGGRLRLGRWMHAAGCRPRVAAAGVGLCARVPAFGRWLIAATRDTAVPAPPQRFHPSR